MVDALRADDRVTPEELNALDQDTLKVLAVMAWSDEPPTRQTVEDAKLLASGEAELVEVAPNRFQVIKRISWKAPATE